MNPDLVKFIGQFVIALVAGGVLVAIINTFLSPKTKAETRSIAQKTAQETIDQALATLRADLVDARAQIAAALDRADKAEKKADLAEATLDAIVARDRVLIQYLWDLRAWSRRWYDGGHPPGMPAPPDPPTAIDSVI